MNFEQYTLYLLTFIFGYITCQTFYFFRATRISVRLLKVLHVIGLSILIKCVEEYSHAGTQKLITLLKCGVCPDDEVYKKTERLHEEETELFKKRGVAIIISLHPDYFKPIIEFEDWKTAMVFLEANKKIAQTFLS